MSSEKIFCSFSLIVLLYPIQQFFFCFFLLLLFQKLYIKFFIYFRTWNNFISGYIRKLATLCAKLQWWEKFTYVQVQLKSYQK